MDRQELDFLTKQVAELFKRIDTLEKQVEQVTTNTEALKPKSVTYVGGKEVKELVLKEKKEN